MEYFYLKNFFKVSSNNCLDFIFESLDILPKLSIIVHSLSSGKVKMFICAACHAFTPHVNGWKRLIAIVVQV